MKHTTSIIGHVGKDAEMRFTKGDPPKNVTTFSVAAQEGFGNNKKTVWFRVSAWAKLGETCNQYVKKGMLISVDGRLNADDNGCPRIWQDSNGKARASFEITANEVRFLSKPENAKQEQLLPEDEPY